MTDNCESKKEVTVIIPNYNGKNYLSRCLASLSSQTYKDFDVIVVDNGSTDGSRNWIEENGIDAILNESNTGFAAAVNAGIKKSETPFVLLLNNDTEAEPDFIEKLVNEIKSSDDLFSVNPLMIKQNNHNLIDDAGDGITILGWAFQRGLDNPVSRYQSPQRVFSSCGGASIYRKKVFEEIGYFDEMHFAYLEDIDIGWRANLKGYKNVFCPEAKIYHVGSATSGSKYNDFKVRLTVRNNIYLHYKNQPIVQLIINAIPLLLGIGIKALFFHSKGFGNAYSKGLKEGFDNIGKLTKAKFTFKGVLWTEWQMITGTFAYLISRITRQS